LKRLSRAGAEPEPSPDVEVLRRVNHRRFALELGGGAPGSRYVEARDELAATLREPNVPSWLFKRPFGFAGRGQRRIRGDMSEDDRRWLDDSLRQGGLLAEPFVDITRELAVHGRIDRTGRVELGRLCTQRIDRTRCWVGTELLPESMLEPSAARSLRERAEAVSAALFAAGYFGPFNVDAYLWVAPSGEVRLNSLGEINARYSMGFAVGMG
jgi:phosphoribosylaminoimidazole carboxylase (NCAIR synthetase)